jgi:hypothetical protein
MMGSNLLIPFPAVRRPTIDEVRISILRETAVAKVQEIALGLLHQMEDSQILRCDYCARPIHEEKDQATS